MEKKELLIKVSIKGRYVTSMILIILGLLLLYAAENNLAMIICEILFIILGFACLTFGRYCIKFNENGLELKGQKYSWSEIKYISIENIAAQKMSEELNRLEKLYNGDTEKIQDYLKNYGYDLETLEYYESQKNEKGIFIGLENLHNKDEFVPRQIDVYFNGRDLKNINKKYEKIMNFWNKYKEQK